MKEKEKSQSTEEKTKNDEDVTQNESNSPSVSTNEDHLSEDSTHVHDSVLDKWLDNFQGLEPDSYWLTRIVLLRAIAFIFGVAFLVAFQQNKQLIGDDGLLPLRLHLRAIKEKSEGSWYHRVTAAPTLLWLADPWTEVDSWLDNLSLLGLTLSSIILITGSANFFMLFTLWLLYHSLVAVGQRWYSFGWESQLLETSLLISWGLSFMRVEKMSYTPPSFVTVYGLRWLLFRIMLGAGLIKIRGDLCWRNFTCMNYHYETQPVPNPLSYFLHHSPTTVHSLEVLGNHLIELLVPWLVFGNRTCLLVCGLVQITFQVILIVSGNLSFLNWLTIVPSLACFDDKFYSRFFSRETERRVATRQILQEKEHPVSKTSFTRDLVNTVLVFLLVYLSLPVAVNLLSSRQAMNTSYDPLRIVNTYGAFGSVTKERHEIILEGLHPNGSWLEYEFKCKPGRVDSAPCLISPYHYRLDWLMWFAAMQQAEHNPWLFHLIYKLLRNEDTATSLIHHNPFQGTDPPGSIRAQLYQYQFTPLFSNTSHWYSRTLKQTNYIRPLDLGMMRPLIRKMEWQR